MTFSAITFKKANKSLQHCAAGENTIYYTFKYKFEMCCGHICRVTGKKKNVQNYVLYLSRLKLQKRISQNTKSSSS